MSSKLKFVYIQGQRINLPESIEKSLHQPNSLHIGNKESGTSLEDIESALKGKIDHNTKILVNTHGNWDPIMDEHYMLLGTNRVLTSYVLKEIQKCTEGPIQVYILSCLSGGIEKIDGLHPESIFTTSSRKNEVTFPGMNSQYIHYDQDFSYTYNPYNYFSKMLFAHAANYGRFVTSKGVFELSPSYEVLIDSQKARDFLSKEAERFYEFSKDKKWDREYSAILAQEYSKEQVHFFRGDLFVYNIGLGKIEFQSFLETQLRQSNALQEIINYSLPNGVTPLTLAVCHGHTETVKLLLENNADPNLKTNHEVTPLFFAAHKGHTEIVKLLLEHNADPNKSINYGDTPLHEAVRKEHTEIVKLLLQNNADPSKKNEFGTLPFHYTRSSGNTEIIDLLEEANRVLQLDSLEQAVKKNGIITHGRLEKYSLNVIKEYISKLKGWACIDYQIEDGEITNSKGVMSNFYSLFCYSLESSINDVSAREIASIEVY